MEWKITGSDDTWVNVAIHRFNYEQKIGGSVRTSELRSFEINYDLPCPDCGARLLIKGLKENNDNKYNVIAYCPICKKIDSSTEI